MLKLSLIILATALSAALSYWYASPSETVITNTNQPLQLTMNQVTGMISDRNSDKKIRYISDQASYDDMLQKTTLTPFKFYAISANTYFIGSSQHAEVHQNHHHDIITLIDQVHIQQTSHDSTTKDLVTERLIIDTNKHEITSPSKVRLFDRQQSLEGDSLVGNYDTGQYEFTQHVHSQWK